MNSKQLTTLLKKKIKKIGPDSNVTKGEPEKVRSENKDERLSGFTVNISDVSEEEKKNSSE